MMKQQKSEFFYLVYDSADELDPADRMLLQEATQAAHHAYAPYSKFYVGAAARLSNGEIVQGSNQENASFPVGICAERVLLSSTASRFPGVAIDSIAITYQGHATKNDHPISPCGMCRQALHEFEARGQKPIRLILGGTTGKVYVIASASMLLPLPFGDEDLAEKLPRQ